MTREQMKSHFAVHANGQDEWIKVGKRIYDKAIDMFCAAHEAELKTKDERIEAQSSVIIACQNAILQKDKRITELEAMVQKMCAECECAKFADNAIKPSEMWKLHTMLKDSK